MKLLKETYKTYEGAANESPSKMPWRKANTRKATRRGTITTAS